MSKLTKQDKEVAALCLLGLASGFTAIALLGSEPNLEHIRRYNDAIADCHKAHKTETPVRAYLFHYTSCMHEKGFHTSLEPFSFR